MSTDQLLQTINMHKQQIQRLNNVINLNGQVDFQTKYKKALRDISGVIKANRQLKQELDQLRNQHNHAQDSHYQIQKQQFQKAYEKLLQQKNQLALDNRNLQFQRQKAKYSLNQMEQYNSQLKNQNHILAREKQALQMRIQKLSRQFNKKSELINMDQQLKKQFQTLKLKETQYIRTLEGYQEHHANLNKLNRQSGQKILELQQKLLKSQQKILSFDEKKQAEIQLIKMNLKKQISDQIAQLKKQNFALRAHNSDLQIKLQSQEIQRSNNSKNVDYEVQLVNAIKDLQLRMQPMKNQITDLKQKNQAEKDDTMRQKAYLKMKTIQLQSDIQTKEQSIKNLQKRLIKSQQEVRKYLEQQKMIKKLEEQNRILGGRVIVLQSKDVALRNRNSQDLQQRVIQFQNRVSILLNNKENFSNVKNVSIHQLIALKAYILELDGKLKSLIQQNQYSNKKYKSYKEKYQNIVKKHKQHDSLIISYKTKIAGYDKLFQKMQGQLERAINMEEIQINAYEVAGHQVIRTQQQFRKYINSMKEKFELQEKYKKQELDTLKLTYQTKLMEANLKLEQLKNLKQTVRLYKEKNQDLGNKLMKKQNQIIQIKFSKQRFHVGVLQENVNAPIYHNRQLINTLQLRISQKDSLLVKQQLEIRNMEDQWKKRFSRLQFENLRLKELNHKPNSPKINIQETTIFEMDQQIRKYRAKIVELQNQIMVQQMKKPSRQDDSRQRQLSHKIARLQFDLQEANNKAQAFENLKRKYQLKINQLEQEIRRLQGNLSKQKIQLKQKIQQHILILNRKDQQLRNQYFKISSDTQFNFKVSELQNINHRYALQIEHLKAQLSKSIKASQMQNNKDSQLSVKYENLSFKYQINNEQKQRLHGTVKRLQDRLRDIQNQLRQKQGQLMRVQSQYKHLKIQFQSTYTSSSNNIRNEIDINNLNQVITNLNQQVYRLTQSNTFLTEQSKRKDNQIYDLRDQIDIFKISGDSNKINLSMEIQRLSQQKQRLKDQIESLQRNLNDSNQQIKFLNETINHLNIQLANQRIKKPSSEFQNYNIDSQIRSLTNDNNRLKIDLQQSQSRINELERQLIFAQSQINKFNIFKDQNERLKRLIEQHRDTIQNLRTKLINIQNSDQMIGQTSNMNQIHHLKNQISKLQKIIRDLRNQQNKTTFHSQFDESYYKNKVQHLQAQIIELRNKNNLAIISSPDRSEQNKRVRELEEQIKNLILNLEKYEININSFTVQIKQLKFQIQQKDQIIISSNNDRSIQVSNFKSEIDALRSDNQTMHRIIIQRDNQIHSLRLQIQSLKSIQTQTQIVILKSEVNTLKKDIENKLLIISQRDVLIKEKQKQIISLNKKIQVFKSASPQKIETIVYQNNREEIQVFQNYIKKMEESLQLLIDELEKLKAKNQQKQNQLIEISNQLNQAQSFIQQLRRNFDNCQRDLFAIRDQYQRYRTEIEQSEDVQSSKIKILNTQKSNLLKVIQQFEEHLLERNKIIQQRSVQIESLRVQINNLTILINSKSSVKQFTQSQKSQVQQLKFIIKKLQEDLSKQESTDLEFRQRVSRKEIEIFQKQKIIDELNEKYSKIQTILKEKEQIILIINKKNEQLNKNINILKNQPKSQQLNNFNYEERYNLIIIQLNQKNNLIKNLQNQIQNLKLTINSLKEQIKDKENSINILSEQLRKAKIVATQQQFVLSENSQNSLTIQIARLVKQLNKLQIMIAQNQRIIQQKDNLFKEQSKINEQQRSNLQKQIFQLKTNIQVLIQSQSHDSSSQHANIDSSRIQQIKRALRAYQQQIQRLNKIIQQLDQDGKFLRLKLTQMTNQQDRISQNLKVMVLTFAEIQALRDRLQSKQNEIADVRNSLIAISRRQAQTFKIQSRFIQQGQIKQGQIKRSQAIQTIQSSDYNINLNNLTTPEQIQKRIKERSKSMNRLQELKSTIFSNPNRSITESKSTYIQQGSQFKTGYQLTKPEIYQTSYVQSSYNKEQYGKPIDTNFTLQKPLNFNLSNTQYSTSQKSGNISFNTGIGNIGNQFSYNTGILNPPSSFQVSKLEGSYPRNFQFQQNQRRI